VPKNVQIDGSKITDWDSFHKLFTAIFGFPDFYGRNMNSWVDCMTYLDDPGAGMTSINVPPGDVLVLCITGVLDFRKRCPEIYDALLESSAFVNWRRIEKGEQAVLALSYHE
jgi:hypothetical protein